MEFLYWLEGIRTSLLDQIMLFFTAFGEETLFIVIAMIFFWCVSKKDGYYLLLVGFTGTNLNQLLKVSFRVPRPWVLDPNFKAVEAAVPEATGYSFPSGHTQSAVGSFSGVALITKHKILKLLSILLIVFVPFSRMYLGVHTPLDVGVSFVLALLLAVGFQFLFRKIGESQKGMQILFSVLTALFLIQAIVLTLVLNGSEEELLSGLKSCYKMLGCIVGLFAVYELDTRRIRFQTAASLPVQILKVVLGLVATLAVKELCYAVFGWISFEPLSRCISYFIMVVFAGAVWPLTFPLFNKLFGKKQKKAADNAL